MFETIAIAVTCSFICTAICYFWVDYNRKVEVRQLKNEKYYLREDNTRLKRNLESSKMDLTQLRDAYTLLKSRVVLPPEPSSDSNTVSEKPKEGKRGKSSRKTIHPRKDFSVVHPPHSIAANHVSRPHHDTIFYPLGDATASLFHQQNGLMLHSSDNDSTDRHKHDDHKHHHHNHSNLVSDTSSSVEPSHHSSHDHSSSSSSYDSGSSSSYDSSSSSSYDSGSSSSCDSGSSCSSD